MIWLAGGILLAAALHGLLGWAAKQKASTVRVVFGSAGRAAMRSFTFLFPRTFLWMMAAWVMWPWIRRFAFPGVEDAVRATGLTHDEAAEILGVNPYASQQEIERAFRSKMRVHHPDVGGTDEMARQINSARDKLRRTF